MKVVSAVGKGVKSFGLFWWDFIVGEDVTLALAVIIGLAVTYALHKAGEVSWWALGAFWVIALVGSLMRVVRKARAADGS